MLKLIHNELIHVTLIGLFNQYEKLTGIFSRSNIFHLTAFDRRSFVVRNIIYEKTYIQAKIHDE